MNDKTDDGGPREFHKAAPQAPEFTEEALALLFVARHSGELRYVAAWNKWFHWNGYKWEEEKTLYAFDLARILCRQQSMRSDGNKQHKTLASAKTRAAVVSLAREDRQVAATEFQWDTDLWLLNTPGGVVDLRTGTMRPARPEDYCTKSTAVAPGGDCPMWLKFLKTVTAGDAALQSYLQRACGYTLTGLTIEHALFFLYGIGSNGKGTFLNTVAAIHGDYHRGAAIETFEASTGDRHPADLAALRGARLVTASETEEGKRWSESRIKQLTGGDIISARFMRSEWFDYVPQFKLFFQGNHKPGLRTVSVAIRRRMNLLPFAVVISEEQRDKNLAARLLKEEGPGILSWMIEGCLAWQKDGLAPPQSVRQATDEYLTAEDSLGAWIEDCCECDLKSHTSTRLLFLSWKAWAETTGNFVGDEKRFASKLDDAGYKYERLTSGKRTRGYWGLSLVRRPTATDGDLPF